MICDSIRQVQVQYFTHISLTKIKTNESCKSDVNWDRKTNNMFDIKDIKRWDTQDIKGKT